MGKDSCWSWLILASVSFSQIIIGGVCFNAGLFYITFARVFDADPVVLSWLCSMPVTFWYFSTSIGSAITNRFGYRTCAFIGGVLSASGICCGYFAPNIYFLFFSHGILTGVGFGINHTGCYVALNNVFNKYKTVAMGIASIGNNGGLVLFAELIVLLDITYSWRGMMLIIGALTFNLCVGATLMSPNNSHLAMKQDNKKTCDGMKRTIKKKSNYPTINFTVFRKLSFISFCGSNVFVNISMSIYYLQIPSFVLSINSNESTIGTMWLVFAIANIVGKVFFSSIGQHKRINTTVVYTVSLFLTGISICVVPIWPSYHGIMAAAGGIGFFCSVTGCLIQAVVLDIVGFDRFADGTGLSMPFKAIGNLIGGPIAGFLLAATGTYTVSFYLAAAGISLASILMIYPLANQLCKSKIKDINTVQEILLTDGT